MKLWLDDSRRPPDPTWTWVRTIEAAKELMLGGEVTEVSLDNDLGDDARGARLREGRELCLWMAEHDRWPSEAIAVHSANVVAVAYLVGIIDRYGPFRPSGLPDVFVRSDDGAAG